MIIVFAHKKDAGMLAWLVCGFVVIFFFLTVRSKDPKKCAAHLISTTAALRETASFTDIMNVLNAQLQRQAFCWHNLELTTVNYWPSS